MDKLLTYLNNPNYFVLVQSFIIVIIIEIIKPFVKSNFIESKIESIYHLCILFFAFILNLLTFFIKGEKIQFSSFELYKFIFITSAFSVLIYDMGYKKIMNLLKEKLKIY